MPKKTKRTYNQWLVLIVVIGFITVGLVSALYAGLVLSGFFVPTPAGEAGEKIMITIKDGRTNVDISTTTDVYIWKTLNVSNFTSYDLVVNDTADQIEVTIENSSYYYMVAYNKTGYLTRWSSLVAGANTRYLYKSPQEAGLQCIVLNETFQDWSAETSENISVFLKIGLEDELNYNTTISPGFNYERYNYTRILLNFTFNDTLTTTNVSMYGGVSVVEVNTSNSMLIWFTDMGISFTQRLVFNVELQAGINCTSIAWGLHNFDDGSLVFPTNPIEQVF